MYRSTGQKQGNLYTPEQVRRVVEGAGLNIVKELDTNYIVFCPYHNNFRTPAGEIDNETGRFFCFSCQENRPLIELVKFMTNRTYFEAIRFIDSHATDDDIVGTIDKVLDKSKDIPEFDEEMITKLHRIALGSPRAVDYYAGRKITMDSILKFKLGYSEKMDMVTTPVLSPDGSAYWGFVGRSVMGKEFKNSTGNWRSQTLFNLARAKKYDTVYVVESNFDAIRLDQGGAAAVATLGAYASRTQMDLLDKYFNYIILPADNDDGGEKMKEKMHKRFGSKLSIVGLPQRFKDIGDMSEHDISQLIKKVDDPLLSMI